ncbi:superoxide dismutase family protein [Sphingorhabdus sp. Alg239-R122]|uniref:superoxide dismutase family protein n=1 Tax=Sphingorhabdus sp. Alg239-R122 TaxID=2305989 RepID=UPI001F07D317|nr:superoxide dismutase family protein [Sphingorhabdus sp. Alg239-R122]
MRTSIKALIFIPLMALAACDNQRVEPPVEAARSQVARAELHMASGEAVGEAIIAQGSDGLLLTLNAENLPAGEKGVHIHMTGACKTPDFKSAGGHWNPQGAQHGLENPQGAHAGDLPNLVIAGNGTGILEASIAGGTVQEGDMALMDSDGAAFVIHAGPDDMKTDPSGDSGSRIACGVFALSTGGVN